MTIGSKKQWQRVVTVSLAGFLWGTVPEPATSSSNPSPMHQRVIVQGANLMSVATAVRAVGGEVTHELGIINAIGARLTPTQIRRLEAGDDTLRIQADRITRVSAWKSKSRSSKSRSSKSKSSSKGEQDSTPQFEAPQGAAWDAATARSQSIAREWEQAAAEAVREAGLAVQQAKDSPIWNDGIWGNGWEAQQEAEAALREDEQWARTVKEWNKHWAKDGFLPDSKPTFFPSLIDVHRLHDEQITGADVTVAFIDTGLSTDTGLSRGGKGRKRVLASYDARTDTLLSEKDIKKGNDLNGHGSHVTAVAVGSRHIHGKFNGVAPDAEVVVVKAFGEQGEGTYADVIRGLDWVLQNHERLNIRVLNLSFSTPPQSHYWDDPINQAVMRLWEAGIVVVASAGNTGPSPMTIGVPGNLPYVITVGAMTDSYTPDDPSDDRLTWFSAAGPTHEGFVKPDLVAPGGHIRGVMPQDAYIPQAYPQFHDGGYYFAMSGTSQAAAVVTGIAALMLQVDPALTPDEVKFRLQAASRPAVDDTGALVVSVFQQGAGLINAWPWRWRESAQYLVVIQPEERLL